MHSTHTFEVPVYTALDDNFRESLNSFSASLAVPVASAQYFRGELSFSSLDEDGNSISLSLNMSKGLPKSYATKVLPQISNFASKFNCAASLVGKGGIRLSVAVSDPSGEDKKMYGKAVCHIITATATVTALPIEMAIDSFFSVIDLSPRTFK